MAKQRSIWPIMTQFAIVLTAVMPGGPGHAQAPERTAYPAPPGWTVTTYRAAETKAFLRCSAERHYNNGSTLTVAKTSSGNFVLGFTSSEWNYEDRSTHSVSIHIDSGEEISLPGRVRLLPSGPIVFIDIDGSSGVVSGISSGMMLHVASAEIDLEFELTGSAAAILSVDQCHRDGSG